jgi:hypothetical protein
MKEKSASEIYVDSKLWRNKFMKPTAKKGNAKAGEVKTKFHQIVARSTRKNSVPITPPSTSCWTYQLSGILKSSIFLFSSP